MQVVYKITNKINNKIYIGSTCDTIDRFNTHFNKYKSQAKKTNSEMYKDMIENNLTINDFSIEIVEEFEDIVDASRLESKLIRGFKNKELLYNKSLGASGRRVFDEEDIVFIRNLYQQKKLYIFEAYDKYYKDKVTFRAFKKVWYGETFKDIAYHVYTKENKAWHFSKGQSRPGESNGRSVFTESDVINIRILKRKGIPKQEVKKLYTDKNFKAPTAFNAIWRYDNWKNIK